MAVPGGLRHWLRADRAFFEKYQNPGDGTGGKAFH
jgi:hypothetical protein